MKEFRDELSPVGSPLGVSFAAGREKTGVQTQPVLHLIHPLGMERRRNSLLPVMMI